MTAIDSRPVGKPWKVNPNDARPGGVGLAITWPVDLTPPAAGSITTELRQHGDIVAGVELDVAVASLVTTLTFTAALPEGTYRGTVGWSGRTWVGFEVVCNREFARSQGDAITVTIDSTTAIEVVVVGPPGPEGPVGPPTTDASLLTSGTLPIGRIADGAITAAKVASDVATQAELDAEATARANADTALDARLDVIEALGPLATDAEVAAAVAAHAAESDPHPGYLTATEGYSAFEPVGTVATHTGDATDAHAASAIGFTPSGTIAATTAQAAIVEVATEAAAALATHEADTTNVHGVTDTATLTRRMWPLATTPAGYHKIPGISPGDSRTIAVPTLGRPIGILFRLDRAAVVEAVSFDVSTASDAGAQVRIGIMSLPDTFPATLTGTVAVDFGAGALDTTGQKTLTLGSAVTIQPGWYVLFAICPSGVAVAAVLDGVTIAGNAWSHVASSAGLWRHYSAIQHTSDKTADISGGFQATYGLSATPSVSYSNPLLSFVWPYWLTIKEA